MQSRARCKILCQLTTALLQAYVLLADLKLHASPFLPGIAPYQWPCSMLSDIHRGRVYPVWGFYSITCTTLYVLHGYVVHGAGRLRPALTSCGTERAPMIVLEKPQRPYRYRVVDVFTQHPLEGNPLAVFPDATGLDDLTMQRIARELNLSATTSIGA